MSHSHRLRSPTRADRLPGALATVVLALALAAVAVIGATWPSGVGQVAKDAGVVNVGVEYVTARVDTATSGQCAGTSEDQKPDGTVPAEVTCLQVTATVLDGSRAGATVQVYAPSSVTLAQLGRGTQVVLERYPPADGATETWAWTDFRRTAPLGVLALAFLAVTALVGGWRGMRALAGLTVAMAVLWFYLVPALITGHHQVAATVAACVAIMTVVGYLTHGWSERTTTALLGTFVGIGLVTALAVAFSAAANLNPVADEQSYYLAQLLGSDGVARLHAIYLAGVVLAGLGILNDVTITQASAVHELHLADPTAPARALVTGGMRIGRDHLASTIYTLAFAYAGTALPLLLTLAIYQLPTARALTGGTLPAELVRTGVGAIGLLLAIPATTALAAVVEARRPGPGSQTPTTDPAPAS